MPIRVQRVARAETIYWPTLANCGTQGQTTCLILVLAETNLRKKNKRCAHLHQACCEYSCPVLHQLLEHLVKYQHQFKQTHGTEYFRDALAMMHPLAMEHDQSFRSVNKGTTEPKLQNNRTFNPN